ncbi:isoprenylcysteine carboxylmethyltransferase family protein [bacterium]|nr:isoprenylcysteine carboxylmethyltransferase family protein [bacterium]
MKNKNTLRIPIGFAAGALFLWIADPEPRSYAAGALFMILGEAVRFISAGTLIKFEGVTRNGIYGFTRNPLYTGSFLIGAGACIMSRSIIFTVLFLALFPITYFRVIRREESYLVGRYGEEYERYLREVPRFWSGRLNIGEILRESSPFLAVKNRELRAVSGVIAVLAIMAVKMFL